MQRPPRRVRRFAVLAVALTLILSSCLMTEDGIVVVTPGLRTVPLLSPEGLAIVATYHYLTTNPLGPVEFGPLKGMIIVAVATELGYSLFDLATDSILHTVDDSTNAPMFGVVGMSDEPMGPDSYAGVIGFGMGGVSYLSYSGDGSGSFEDPWDYGASVTYDMYPAGGDVFADLVTKVQPNVGVRFLYNPEMTLPPVRAPGEAADAPKDEASATSDMAAVWDISPEVLPAANFVGELVSAFVADDDLDDPAPVLVLTRGVTSNLYLDDRDGDAPIHAQALGLDARKLRCVDTEAATGWLCAISVFGDDQLALLNWDGQNVPVWRGTVDVGDGPVGIDLRLLDDGDVAIVSTGFFDNSVTEVKVTNNGTLVDTQARAVPAGCVSPGHAVYFEDDGGLALVGTCWESDNYYVERSAL